MPRYHFDLDNSIGLVEDEEGRELADLDAARDEGLRGARSIIAGEVLDGRVDLRATLRILDGHRKLLLTIPFAEVVAVIR